MKGKRKTLQELTIMDGFLFGAVMMDSENCRLLLERVLEIPIARVDVLQEKSLVYHPEYKGIRLDVYASDEAGSRYDIEIQVRTTPVEKRSRYYHAQMDMELLLSGMPYDSLPESYVIFICGYDPFGKGKYRYRIENRCLECPDMDYLDGTHTIILNNKGQNPREVPSELVSFLNYTRKSLSESEEKDEDAFISRLQESIRKVKGSREMGERYMTLEEMLREEREEGREEGRQEGREMTIIQMVNEDEISPEKGAEKLGISLEEFQEKLKEYLKTRE